MPRLGERVFRNTSCMALVPEVSLKSWKKAQKMVSQGWENMGFKAKEKYIFPSEDLLQNHIPEDADTVDKKRQHIKVCPLPSALSPLPSVLSFLP